MVQLDQGDLQKLGHIIDDIPHKFAVRILGLLQDVQARQQEEQRQRAAMARLEAAAKAPERAPEQPKANGVVPQPKLPQPVA